MNDFDHRKYTPYPPMPMPQRCWPDRVIERAPRWCSVDLRDGNQALVEPMDVARKTTLFQLLTTTGFKEIEVGFPAASAADFDFVRHLIEGELIPDDVTIQVLTPARDELIRRTFESLAGARRAIVHLYNSTSTLQRERVFGMSREAITALALRGAGTVARCADARHDTDWVLQYSPESFTGTEPAFASAVCNDVVERWRQSSAREIIVNLPATVEMSTPNVYADRIEWFCEHLERREDVIVSLHTHNDRGCAVAAAELGVMAGADRVEGTLLGNGERTGNMDVVTMAMNLYSQGIDPELNLAGMDAIVRTITDCTGLPVHPRHPYAGELVYTAFSGSHQDAIRKCLARQRAGESWQVAYLPIDPADLGRSYQALIRINSQSGKGGIAHVLESEFGIQMPRWLQIDFSQRVQRMVETRRGEATAAQLRQLFHASYTGSQGPLSLRSYELGRQGESEHLRVELAVDGVPRHCSATASGALSAFATALEGVTGRTLNIMNFQQQALGGCSDASALAYVELATGGRRHYGAGSSRDIVEASLLAVIHALNDACQGAP